MNRPPASPPPRQVFPAKTAAALVAVLALFLLVAPGAGAAAYYVGGGKGVKLAVRVVDRQIVWAKLSVRERCLGSRRGYYEYTGSSEGLFGQAQIGRSGAFSSHAGYRNTRKQGDEEVVVENISGHVGPRRLAGRILSYAWFTSSEPPGTHRHGYCRGGGSGPRPPAKPVPVRITAHRRPEPPGLAFYFAAKERGITTYFEVRRRRIVTVETSARLYCTDVSGKRFFNSEARKWRVPIKIGRTGKFEAYEADDDFPFEALQGEVTPDRITGSYGFTYANGEEGRCRTGSFDPGHGRWAVPFVALRR
jgi:hypothetical protein